MSGYTADLTEQAAAIVGAQNVISDPAAQRRFLRDFSWYSPLLSDALADTTVDVVARPATQDELAALIGLAVRLRAPITLRGAGTGNYGQALPLERGLLIDTRRLNRILALDEDRVTVEAGAVIEDAERAARAHGRELRVMPSTYHIATASGFICGGSGGIGSVTYGGIWDGNVMAADLLTAEDPPRRLTLAGRELNAVLHTYGTTGVVATVSLALSEARDWRDAVAVFETFDAAMRFAWRIAADDTIVKRLDSLQEAPLPAMFEPVKRLFPKGASAVLLIVDTGSFDPVARLARQYGGALQPWPAKPAINQFPFSHTILWAKKFDPSYTWLQGRFSTDEQRFHEQVAALKQRFGDTFLVHAEFHRARDGSGVQPASISVITDPDPRTLDAIIHFSEEIGVAVMNPHSYVVQEGGMVGDMDAVFALKRTADPFGLLNPGKVERAFYAGSAAGS